MSVKETLFLDWGEEWGEIKNKAWVENATWVEKRLTDGKERVPSIN